MSRNVMGRGLNALFNMQRPTEGGVRELPLSLLHANPAQPRVDFDEASLEGLAASIRENGVIQPLVVRPMGETYQVITGERRLRAAQKAGLVAVPVVVRQDLGEEDVLLLGLIENLQREDLNPVEEARSLDKLIEMTEMTHEQLAQKIGKSRVHVTNMMRLLKLPQELLGWLRAGRLTAGHARALLGLDLPEQMIMLAGRVIEEGWSVRKLERYIKEYAKQRDGSEVPRTRSKQPRLYRKASKSLGELLGTKVSCRQGADGKGKLTIAFEGKKDLKRILEQFQGLELEDEG